MLGQRGVGFQSPEAIFGPRYSFIKAWRAKIFAKIEWKDTSKNPTGSKNNSLLKLKALTVNERREKSESVSCGSKQSYRSLINTI